MPSQPKQNAELNDQFRRNLSVKGVRTMSAGIAAMPLEDYFAVFDKVMKFDDFTPDNDPYQEHDFGSFHHAGQRIFWKIDVYADDRLTFGAEDPTDPNNVRVLTVMLADEY